MDASDDETIPAEGVVLVEMIGISEVKDVLDASTGVVVGEIVVEIEFALTTV